MRMKFMMALAAASLLAGCASMPATPYWENPQWVNELALTVHKDIQYLPNVVNPQIASGNAVIKFIYDNGKLVAPEILTSTGSRQLDQAILAQIPSIRPPLAQGTDANIPHGFALPITVYVRSDSPDPTIEKFYMAVHKALHDQVRYPSAAVHDHAFGAVVINFKYRNGYVIDAKIVGSSGFKTLDDAVFDELQHAKLPPPPLSMANKTLKFSAPFVFNYYWTRLRYAPANTTVTASNAQCAEVVFRYQNGSISHVHLTKSSGNVALDKLAVLDVAQRKIPLPLPPLNSSPTIYQIPVCAHN